MRALITILIFLSLATFSWGQQISFPTAGGFGKFSTGGRGNGTTGYVCHVNTLSTSSTGGQISGTPHYQGSFRYCFERTGARTIIFDVAGTIDYGGLNLNSFSNANATIAGQTAPGDGIAIKGLWFKALTSDVIIRHMRFRAGPALSSADSLTISGNNIIVDHSSFSYGSDENLGIPGGQNTTVQWSILTYPLSTGGAARYNTLIGANSISNTMHHNLFAHSADRNPWVQRGDVEVTNNVMYNVNPLSTKFGPYYGIIFVNVIANYFKPGPNISSTTKSIALLESGHPSGNVTASGVYLAGNIHPVIRPDLSSPETNIYTHNAASPQIPVVGSPYNFPSVSTTDANTAYNDIITNGNVGATKPVQDELDLQIIDEVKNSTGNWVPGTDPEQVGGWPTLTGTSRDPDTYDTDWDGIPNAWESQCGSALGLSPSDSNDGNDIISGINSDVNGYSKLEVYLNAVAGDYGIDGVSNCAGLLDNETDPPSTPVLSDPSVVSYDQVDLSWTASTDASGIGNYIVTYCIDPDETADCTPNLDISMGDTELAYSHIGLQPDTIYGYQVGAIDTLGNEGSKSTPIKYVTTDSAPAGDYTSNLLSHWTCNNTADDSGSGVNHGTWVGTPSYDANGKVGQACSFNGTNQGINMGSDTDIDNITTGSFALWIMPLSQNTYRTIAEKAGSDSSGDWGLQIYPSNSATNPDKLFFLTRLPTQNNLLSVNNMPDQQWQHIVVTWSASGKKLYVNGQLNASSTIVGEMSDAGVDLFIGSFGGSLSWYKGLLDDIRLYSGRVLNEYDVLALYNSYVGGDTESPTAPSNLSVTTLLISGAPAMSLEWDASTDNSGSPSYSIERCLGDGCSGFSQINTTMSTSIADEFLPENTILCYRVRAFDAASNFSGYSNAECKTTFLILTFPGQPTTLSTTHSSTVTMLAQPSTLSTTHSSTITALGQPSTLSTTHSSTVTVLGSPSGLDTP